MAWGLFPKCQSHLLSQSSRQKRPWRRRH